MYIYIDSIYLNNVTGVDVGFSGSLIISWTGTILTVVSPLSLAVMKLTSNSIADEIRGTP